MYQSILAILIVFTLFQRGLSDEEIPRLPDRPEIDKCYKQIKEYIIHRDATKIENFSEMCTDAMDIPTKLHDYLDKGITNITIDQTVLDNIIFMLKHRYAKDFLTKRGGCTANYTRVVNSTKEPGKKYPSFSEVIFHEDQFPTKRMCDQYLVKKSKIRQIMNNNSDKYVCTFWIDMYDHMIEKCNNKNTPEKKCTECTPVPSPAILSAEVTWSLIGILILIVLVLVIIVLKKVCIYPNTEKNADQLPNKTIIP